MLEALKKLHSINAGIPQEKNRNLVAFELPQEVDVFLNNSVSRTKLKLDDPRYPYTDRVLPRRIKERHRGGPRLYTPEFYARKKDLWGFDDKLEDWQIETLETMSYCPPDCATVWKGRELVAIVDNYNIFNPNRTYSDEHRVGRMLDEVIGLVNSEYRRLGSSEGSEINPKG